MRPERLKDIKTSPSFRESSAVACGQSSGVLGGGWVEESGDAFHQATGSISSLKLMVEKIYFQLRGVHDYRNDRACPECVLLVAESVDDVVAQPRREPWAG